MAVKAICIGFANQKGGTGKTTSCVNIAGYLAMSGHKVLVVDFDPMASATSALGIDYTTLEYSIYDVVLSQFKGYKRISVKDVILQTDVENLHIVPSELDLSVSQVLIKGRTHLLDRILTDVKPFYDFILIDLPPNFGFLMVNGICASDLIFVPLEPSIFSLEAVENLKSFLYEVKSLAGHSIIQLAAILIRYEKPNIVSKLFGKVYPSLEVESKLRQIFSQVFLIPSSAEVYVSQKKGLPISHVDPKGKLGRAYKKIADSIIQKGGNI